MGNYEQLKQAISDVIKTNGNQEITGAILQNALLTIISTIGGNATFAGTANPETNPGTPDARVFYLANKKGVYTGFGGIEIKKNELNVLFTDQNVWKRFVLNVLNVEDLQQELGNSETDTMSQKAISAEINTLKTFTSLNESIDFVNTDEVGYSYIYPLNIKGKIGDKLTVKVSNAEVTKNGKEPSKFAVALRKKDGSYMSGVIYWNGETNITLDDETYIIGLYVNINQGIATLKCDIELKYNSITDEIQKLENKVSSINTASWKYHLEKGETEKVILSYNFRKGDILWLKVYNKTTTGSGDNNVNIRDVDDSNKVLLVEYTEGIQYVELLQDTNNISILIAYVEGVETFSVDTKLLYGSSADLQIQIDEVNQNLQEQIEHINEMNSFIQYENSNIKKNGTLNDWIYAKEKYVGYNKPFNKKTIIKSISFRMFEADNTDVGKEFEFFIGTIDQRNWMLPRLNFTAQIKSVTNGKVTFDFIEKEIIARENEVILFKAYSLGKTRNNVLCGLSTNTFDVGNKLMTTSSLSNPLIAEEQKGLDYYIIEALEFDSLFAQNEYVQELQSSITDLQEQIEHINEMNSFIQYENSNIKKNGTLNDWIYAKEKYVGYNKPFNKKTIIKSISFRMFEADNTDVGKEFEFFIGTIDQRNWMLPRLNFTAQIKSVTNGKVTFDFIEKEIIARENEVILFKAYSLGKTRNNVLCGLSTNTFDVGNKLMTTSSLSNPLIAEEQKGLDYYIIEALEFDSLFAQNEYVQELQSSITDLQEQINNSNVYTDRITGDKYVIAVSNGEIILQSLTISNMLVIGHSFVVYGNAPQADWYLDDGENRAMAASVNPHQWVKFIDSQTGATSELKSGVDFERNYSVDYDFASKWNVQDNYDAICVYLCENAIYSDTMYESWKVMLNYLKQAAPRARIYCTASWGSGEKEQAIKNACIDTTGIVYVDCMGLNVTTTNKSNQWLKGDYYFGRESQYYPMGAPFAHPNDKGHLDIANRFLNSMGYDLINNIVHEIKLIQVDGGIITTPNQQWLENAIVTIRVNPNIGKTIENISVVKDSGGQITADRRENNMSGTNKIYYTFIMPNENVTITPIFRNE